jgi:hypothetical protein
MEAVCFLAEPFSSPVSAEREKASTGEVSVSSKS